MNINIVYVTGGLNSFVICILILTRKMLGVKLGDVINRRMFIMLVLNVFINYIFIDSLTVYPRVAAAFVIYVITTYIVYTKNMFTAFVVTTFSHSMLLFTDSLNYLLFTQMLNVNIDHINLSRNLSLAMQLSFLLLVMLISCFIRPMGEFAGMKLKKLVKNKWRMVQCILIHTVMICGITYLISTQKNPGAMYIACLLLMAGVVYNNKKYFGTLCEDEKEHEEKAAIQEYALAVENNLTIKSKKAHESDNHLISLRFLIESGEHERALAYLNDIANVSTSEWSSDINYAKIKHPLLKNILTVKTMEAVRAGISVDTWIRCDMENMDVPDTDLNAMICIIMDNAREAVLKSEEKQITIMTDEEENGDLSITIRNTCDSPVIDDIYGPGKSTKCMGHGYGLNILNDIEEKNENVVIETKALEDSFTQIIIITKKQDMRHVEC